MGRTIAAIIAIFLCTTLAWLILGISIDARTHGMGSDLGPRVESLWGAPQEQAPPTAFKTLSPNDPLALQRSRVQVALDLEQRQKGLLWFPTYRVNKLGDGVAQVHDFILDIYTNLVTGSKIGMVMPDARSAASRDRWDA